MAFSPCSDLYSVQPAGGAVASWLVCSTPKRAVRVRALAGDIELCSWARHFTLTVPLSSQVYKWVPANLMLGGNPAMDKHPIQGREEILLVASCYRNRDKLRPGGPHWPVCRLYLFIKRSSYIKRLIQVRLYIVAVLPNGFGKSLQFQLYRISGNEVE